MSSPFSNYLPELDSYTKTDSIQIATPFIETPEELELEDEQDYQESEHWEPIDLEDENDAWEQELEAEDETEFNEELESESLDWESSFDSAEMEMDTEHESPNHVEPFDELQAMELEALDEEVEPGEMLEDQLLEDEVDEEEIEYNEIEFFNKADPIQLPKANPVPFARTPLPGSYWPVITSHPRGREVAYQMENRKQVGSGGRRFLASRSDGKRFHAGVDLFANHHDPVVACEDGVIRNYYHFYRGTYCLIVEHQDLVINYGEVAKDSMKKLGLKIGSRVKAGQQIGFVGKMFYSSMLHFETYRAGTKSNKRFKVGRKPPTELLNPTNYLLALNKTGLSATVQRGGGNISSKPTGTSGSSMPTLDIEKAIQRNRHHGAKLGWNKLYDKINDLLLPLSGMSNVSLGERAFARSIALWQSKNGFSGKDVDGILGPKTWARMQSVLGSGTSRPSGPGGIPEIKGTLRIDTSVPALRKSNPSYQFTKEDALWLARFIEGEVGRKNDKNSQAVVWAMFNRFGMLRHRVSSWSSFQKFLRLYSTTLQPMLRSRGAAQRVWKKHKRNPSRHPVEVGQGTYKNSTVKKVQLKKHIDLQKKPWNRIDPDVRDLAVGILNGKIGNPGIGIATEFASTRVFYINKYNRQPSTQEWRKYTIDYAEYRCKRDIKGCTWVGDVPGIDQMKNAFFIDNRFLDIPASAVTVS